MGREARCTARYGEQRGDVTALLETHELILRGAVRARIPRADLRDVAVVGADLTFDAAGVPLVLTLGIARARSWQDFLAKPPPSLAEKLGITTRTRLHVIGAVDDDALAAAIAVAAKPNVPLAHAELLLLRTDDAAVLRRTVDAFPVTGCPPVWVVYAKGRGAPLGERTVREAMRERGFADVKAAGISTKLTALRFVRQAESPTEPRKR